MKAIIIEHERDSYEVFREVPLNEIIDINLMQSSRSDVNIFYFLSHSKISLAIVIFNGIIINE